MTMNRQQWSLLGSAGAGAGLGASLMCLLDSQSGGRRRALVRDKTVHLLRKGGDAALKTSRDLGNRSKGVVLGTASKLRREPADGRTLSDRVRAHLGRVVSHPSSIEVMADESGRVVLTGSVLGFEHDRLLKTVRKVKGVKEVEDRLYVYEQAGNVPELQGGDTRTSWLRQRSWRPSPRLLAGTALGVAGLGLLARELAARRSGAGADVLTGSQVLLRKDGKTTARGETVHREEVESSLHLQPETVHF